MFWQLSNASFIISVRMIASYSHMLFQYTSMLSRLAAALDMEDLPELRGASHTSSTQDKPSAVQLLTNRIYLLKERIKRKEELLGEYEETLTKLRYCGWENKGSWD